jgi:hypothetical protein
VSEAKPFTISKQLVWEASGQAILAARKTAGLTQKAVAARLRRSDGCAIFLRIAGMPRRASGQGRRIVGCRLPFQEG